MKRSGSLAIPFFFFQKNQEFTQLKEQKGKVVENIQRDSRCCVNGN